MGLTDIIKKIVEMLPEVMLAGGLVFIIGMFFLITGGAFLNQADEGNIPVSAQTITAINTTQQQLVNATNTVGDQVETTVNYLPLIVIMMIAVGFLGFLGIKKFKQGGI